jgi:hypothetical protein
MLGRRYFRMIRVDYSQMQHHDAAQQHVAGFPALGDALSHLSPSAKAQSYQSLTNNASQT